MGATPTTTLTTTTAHLERNIAFKGDMAYDVTVALDACGITYDWFGHDEVWSVICIHGLAPRGSYEATYEAALGCKGVHLE